MYNGRTIFVVIPAYNVAGHIAQVVKGIPEFVDRIVVVNDNSTDDTLEVLAGIPDPRLTVRSHPIRLRRSTIAQAAQQIMRPRAAHRLRGGSGRTGSSPLACIGVRSRIGA